MRAVVPVAQPLRRESRVAQRQAHRRPPGVRPQQNS